MIKHTRIRIQSGKMEEGPLQYSGVYSKAHGWADYRVAALPPAAIIDSVLILDPGGTVPSIGTKHARKNPVAWLFLNGPFFNRDTKRVLGKTIIDGKIVEPDVAGKTENRPHLYCINGKIDIGRVDDPIGVKWAVCGYTLVKGGKYVFPVATEKIPDDVASGYNQRTIAGTKPDGTLITTIIDEGLKDKGATQEQAARYLISLGCTEVIGLDGGGSSTMASNDPDVQSALDLKNGYHVAEIGSSPRAVHHAIGLKLDKSILFPKPRAVFGIDCASPLTVNTAKALAAEGAKYAIRYLTTDKYAWKRLTKAEVEAIGAAGMKIGTVWETTAGRAALGAYSGKEDGTLALQEAAKVGQPEGSVIFFAVDYDADAEDFPEIESYLRAAAAAVAGKYHVGVYGSYMVVEEMAKRGACAYYWQTYAWSRGQKSNHAHLYQYQNDTKLAGVSVDLNEAYTEEVLWNMAKEEEMPKIGDRVNVEINGVPIADGYIIEGRAYISVRAAGDALGMTVGWDPDTRTASLTKK